MAKTKNIPTVEALKSLLAFKDAGIFSKEEQTAEKLKEIRQEAVVRPMQVAEAAAARVDDTLRKVTVANDQLERKVEDLSAQIVAAKARTSPAELRQAMLSLFSRYDFSPAEELILMLKDEANPHYVRDVSLRVKILCEVQQYVMPKLKSTEIHGEVEHNHTIKILRIGPDGGAKVEDMLAPRRVTTIDVEPIKEIG